MAKVSALLLLAAIGFARALAAQTVQGSFVDPAGQPVAGARAILRDAAGRDAATATTGVDGAFVLRARAAGSYTLRVERIGYELTETQPFALTAGETVERRVAANPRRIVLQAIVAESRSRCTPRPGSGPQTATVWGEARKVLGSARESAESGGHRYVVRRYWRWLDAPGQTILVDSVATAELASGTPFMAVPLDRLSRNGYVEPARSELVFHAPDARVLLSDEFQERHCFALQQGENGLIGLSFEPLSNTLPEVRGVLWLDRATAELRRLEYRYVRIPRMPPEGEGAGGWMDFTRLADGRWIVGRWAIRMPLVADTRTRPRGASNATPYILLGIREEGGEVLSAGRVGEAPVQLATIGAGTVAGMVWDSIAGGPLAGARVSVAGHGAVADSAGRFSITGLTAGAYQLTFTSPRLDSLRYAPPPVRVAVREGETMQQVLAIPPLAVVWASACGFAPAGTGTLVGVVRGPTGQPAPGVRTSVQWAGEQPGTAGATTDSAGVYRACGVPAEVPLTVRVAARDASVSVSDVRVAADRPHREDLALPAPRTAVGPGAAAAEGVSGVVRDAEGRPLAGAEVRVGGRPTVTDARGRFRVGRVGSGTHAVAVSHAALGSRTVAVPLPDQAVEVELRPGPGTTLAASVQRVVQIAGIGARAQARRPGLDMQGFYDRQRQGLGVFLTGQSLRRVAGGRLANTLRTVAGVRIVEGGSALNPRTFAMGTRGSTGVGQAGACWMDVYLDGMLVAGQGLGAARSLSLDEIPMADVEAVEVYRGPSEIPIQYRGSTSACGVILLWTRRTDQ
jgi:hypothetical protein